MNVPDQEPAYPPSVNTQPPIRILIVEDEFVVANALETDLRDDGFVVVGVASAAEPAIATACRERPDLVVMDIRLAGQRDGIDAALEIFAATGIRCLFATANSDSHALARAAAAAPLGWLHKPYGKNELLEALGVALRALGRAP